MQVSVGAAQSFIEGEFGGPTEEIDVEVSVGTTATKIVENDPDALALTLINLGSETAWVMFDNKVSTTRGIQLDAGGGVVSLVIRDDQALPTREWYAITSTATTDIFAIRTRRFALTGPDYPPAISGA